MSDSPRFSERLPLMRASGGWRVVACSQSRPWRGVTAPVRNEEEGGLFTCQLRDRLHQHDELDDRREGLVPKLRIDLPWSHPARRSRWRFEVLVEACEVRFKSRVATQVCLGSKGDLCVGRTGGRGLCSTRTAAHLLLLVCAWRAAWPEAGGVPPTCRDEGGSRKGCVRRA